MAEIVSQLFISSTNYVHASVGKQPTLDQATNIWRLEARDAVLNPTESTIAPRGYWRIASDAQPQPAAELYGEEFGLEELVLGVRAAKLLLGRIVAEHQAEYHLVLPQNGYSLLSCRLLGNPEERQPLDAHYALREMPLGRLLLSPAVQRKWVKLPIGQGESGFPVSLGGQPSTTTDH